MDNRLRDRSGSSGRGGPRRRRWGPTRASRKPVIHNIAGASISELPQQFLSICLPGVLFRLNDRFRALVVQCRASSKMLPVSVAVTGEARIKLFLRLTAARQVAASPSDRRYAQHASRGDRIRISVSMYLSGVFRPPLPVDRPAVHANRRIARNEHEQREYPCSLVLTCDLRFELSLRFPNLRGIVGKF